MLMVGKSKTVATRMVSKWKTGLLTTRSVPCEASQQAQNFMQKSWKES